MSFLWISYAARRVSSTIDIVLPRENHNLLGLAANYNRILVDIDEGMMETDHVNSLYRLSKNDSVLIVIGGDEHTDEVISPLFLIQGSIIRRNNVHVYTKRPSMPGIKSTATTHYLLPKVPTDPFSKYYNNKCDALKIQQNNQAMKELIAQCLKLPQI